MYAAPRWRDLLGMLFDSEPKPSPMRRQLSEVRAELDTAREALRKSELECQHLRRVIERRERVLERPAGYLAPHDKVNR